MQDIDQRRKEERLIKTLIVSYAVIPSDNTTPFDTGKAITKDISSAGICFIVGDKMGEDLMLQVKIRITDAESWIYMIGKVKNCIYNPQFKKYEIHIKFIGRLPKLIKENFGHRTYTAN